MDAAIPSEVTVVTRGRTSVSMWRVLTYVVAVVVSVIMLIPFFWSFTSALKSNDDIFVFPPIIFPTQPHWEHFVQGWTSAVGGGPDFTVFTINTAIVATLTVVGTVVSCVLVAYGFARFRFPGRDALFLILLSTMMIPFAVTLIPSYIIYSYLGFVNTFVPLVLPAFFGVPYFVFLLRQFFMSIPYDLDEAARIDGAGSLRILAQVLWPEIQPAVIAMSVLTFIGTWKDFQAPIVYLQDSSIYTIEVGLAQFYNAYSGQPRWDLLTAVALVTMTPMVLIFVVASKYIVKGVTLSGMGGT